MRFIAVVAAAIGILISATASAAPLSGTTTHRPTASTAGSSILFHGGPGSLDPSGNLVRGGVYAIGATGGTLRELVRGDVLAARWSPDGRWLAFTRSVVDEIPQIFVVGARGGAPRLVARGNNFDWSPDSRFLAYVQAGDAHSAIFVVRFDGRARRRVTTDGGGGLSWSPIGGRLAFVHAGRDVRVIGGDGRGRIRVAPGYQALSKPSWSPDGRRLTFSACCPKSLVVVVGADGHGLRTLVPGATVAPAWSPDGKWIALAGSVPTRKGDSLQGMFLVRPDGRQLRRVSTHGGSPFTPAWSPDSRALAFSDSCCRPDLWVLRLSSGVERRVTEGWRYGWDAFDPQWSPPGVATAGREVSSAMPSDSTQDGNTVSTRQPLNRLVADGSIVAYRFDDTHCEGWDQRRGTIVRFVGCGGHYDAGTSQGAFGPALAGERIVWSYFSSYMSGDNWDVATQTVDVPAHEKVSFPASDPVGVGRGYPTTDFAGGGDLLVFESWGPCRISQSPPCAAGPKPNGRLYRLDGGQAVLIASSAGALTPVSVDSGRVLVDHEDGTIELLRADGSSLFSIDLRPSDVLGARLQGSDVVVLSRGGLRDYNAADGSLRHIWLLRGSTTAHLEDVQGGVAVYVADRVIHLVRLSDGRDVALPEPPGGGPVLAQLEASGLFYAYQVPGAALPGRVTFIPSPGLPLQP